MSICLFSYTIRLDECVRRGGLTRRLDEKRRRDANTSITRSCACTLVHGSGGERVL